MSLTSTIPLTALLVTGGFLAAGFAAEASALDRHLEGFVEASPEGQIAVTSATGQGDGETIELVHLTVRADTPANVDLDALTIRDEADRSLAIVDVHPIRDEDGSLEEGVLDGDDLARLVVHLASPMETNDGHVFGLEPPHDADELVVETPAALEDGYTRLGFDQR